MNQSFGNKVSSEVYCRTHNLRVCLYIAYIACGSASLYIKMLYFFICTFFMLGAATVANIKIRHDAKTPQFTIFGTRVICVFYNIWYVSSMFPGTSKMVNFQGALIHPL